MRTLIFRTLSAILVFQSFGSDVLSNTADKLGSESEPEKANTVSIQGASDVANDPSAPPMTISVSSQTIQMFQTMRAYGSLPIHVVSELAARYHRPTFGVGFAVSIFDKAGNPFSIRVDFYNGYLNNLVHVAVFALPFIDKQVAETETVEGAAVQDEQEQSTPTIPAESVGSPAESVDVPVESVDKTDAQEEKTANAGSGKTKKSGKGKSSLPSGTTSPTKAQDSTNASPKAKVQTPPKAHASKVMGNMGIHMTFKFTPKSSAEEDASTSEGEPNTSVESARISVEGASTSVPNGNEETVSASACASEGGSDKEKAGDIEVAAATELSPERAEYKSESDEKVDVVHQRVEQVRQSQSAKDTQPIFAIVAEVVRGMDLTAFYEMASLERFKFEKLLGNKQPTSTKAQRMLSFNERPLWGVEAGYDSRLDNNMDDKEVLTAGTQYLKRVQGKGALEDLNVYSPTDAFYEAAILSTNVYMPQPTTVHHGFGVPKAKVFVSRADFATEPDTISISHGVKNAAFMSVVKPAIGLQTTIAKSFAQSTGPKIKVEAVDPQWIPRYRQLVAFYDMPHAGTVFDLGPIPLTIYESRDRASILKSPMTQYGTCETMYVSYGPGNVIFGGALDPKLGDSGREAAVNAFGLTAYLSHHNHEEHMIPEELSVNPEGLLDALDEVITGEQHDAEAEAGPIKAEDQIINPTNASSEGDVDLS